MTPSLSVSSAERAGSRASSTPSISTIHASASASCVTLPTVAGPATGPRPDSSTTRASAARATAGDSGAPSAKSVPRRPGEQPWRQALEGPAELDRLGEPEPMGGGGHVDDQRGLACIEAVDGARRRARRDGVDEHDVLDTVAERVEQLGRLSAQLQDVGPRQQLSHAPRRPRAPPRRRPGARSRGR